MNRTDMRNLAVRYTYDYLEANRPDFERFLHERLEDLGANPQDANMIVVISKLIELSIAVKPKKDLKYG